MKRRLWNKIDIFVIALIFLASLIPVFLFGGKEGSTVIITKNGREYGTYPLYANQTLQVDGEYPLTVLIQSGAVSVTDAHCPDKICQHTAPVSKAGESIICVPAGVVVRISGEGQVDGIAQ